MIPSMPWLWVVIPIDGADVCAHVCAVSVFVFVFVCVCVSVSVFMSAHVHVYDIFVYACRLGV